jgi:hypothetical protein
MSFLYPASWGASEHLAEAQTSHDCHQSRREFQQSVKQELQSQILLSAENWGQLHSIDLNSQPYAAAVQKLELEVCQVSPEMFWKLEDG